MAKAHWHGMETTRITPADAGRPESSWWIGISRAAWPAAVAKAQARMAEGGSRVYKGRDEGLAMTVRERWLSA